MVAAERRGAATLLTIDRPERRNAVDGATAAALLAAFEQFKADDAACVLVLTGAGETAFCAGADLKAIETLEADAPGGPLGFTRLASPKPTIAAISGWCLAGGLELALWCDLRIATETAVLGCAERRWGVPLVHSAHTAFASGMRVAVLFGVGFTLAGALLAYFFLPDRPAPGEVTELPAASRPEKTPPI